MYTIHITLSPDHGHYIGVMTDESGNVISSHTHRRPQILMRQISVALRALIGDLGTVIT